MSDYDQLDTYRIDEFLGRVHQFTAHSKHKNPEEQNCESCQWTLEKLALLYENMKDYAKMRTTDDDEIDWNLLILEVLDLGEENENEESPRKEETREKDAVPEVFESEENRIIQEQKKEDNCSEDTEDCGKETIIF